MFARRETPIIIHRPTTIPRDLSRGTSKTVVVFKDYVKLLRKKLCLHLIPNLIGQFGTDMFNYLSG